MTVDGVINTGYIEWDKLIGIVSLVITSLTLIITTYFNRKTFKQTNEQLKQNKNQFEEQQRSIHIQQFETTLFNMIKLQQEITEGLELRT